MDELQQQIVQLVQAAMLGDQLASQQILQIMQAAQQGDLLAAQIAQLILLVAQLMQLQLVRAAKFGAKLNYIRLLKGQCPEGYEVSYFEKGGQICKTCLKQLLGGNMPARSLTELFKVDSAKCGRKMKKKACGGSVKKDSCGSKLKAACGSKMKAACGNKLLSKRCGGKTKK